MKKLFTTLILLNLSFIFLAEPLPAEEKTERQKLQAELKKIEKELKPLREKVYTDSQVIEAKKKLDEAFRDYYEVLRERMKAADPSKAELVDKTVELRKKIHKGKSAGSRAEDYEAKAAQ